MPTGQEKPPIRVPDYVLTLLESCPTSGQGVHNWLYRTALALNPLYPDKAALAALLRAASAKCGREVQDSEIRNAIESSAKHLSEARETLAPAHPRWPRPNREAIAAIIARGAGVEALREQSPVPFDDSGRSRVEEVIDALFPGNPLLCVGHTNEKFDTRSRRQWRGILERHQFIVPSPMSAVTGKTQNGKTSKHTLSNTGPRKFLVVEFDPPKWDTLGAEERARHPSAEDYYKAKRDEHAALHFHLGQYAPLTLVVYSGGKSLHGWFFCERQDEAQVRKFMAYAVSLSADPATWTRSQFVRLPEGYRQNNGKLQSVIYFNPATLKTK